MIIRGLQSGVVFYAQFVTEQREKVIEMPQK
jgi:hypothetical protein